jgi:hypothetical protein
MAAGDPSAAAAGDVSPVTSLSPSPVPSAISLREALAALSQVIDQLATPPYSSGNPCSLKPSPPPTQSLDSGDTTASEDAASLVSDVLYASAAVSEVADGGHCDEAPRWDAAARASEELLNEVHAFLSCASSNKVRSLRFVAIFFGLAYRRLNFRMKVKVAGVLIPLHSCDRWRLMHSRLCSRNL